MMIDNIQKNSSSINILSAPSSLRRRVLREISLCRETIHITSGLKMLEDNGVQIPVTMPIEPPQCCYFSQIQAHTNFSQEMVWQS
jgi:hypothetical protein